MRRTFAGLGLLLLASPALGVNPGDTPRATPELRSQARIYAQQLLPFIDYVEKSYYRPVARAALVEAALAGLYDATREPLPSVLRSDLSQAKTTEEVLGIVVSARERLGDADALQGQKALARSIQAVLRSLDPHCGILGPRDRRSIDSDGFFGVGLELEADPAAYALPNSVDTDLPYRVVHPGKRGPVRIADVLPGGPAQRAGVQPGDLITHIDGQEMRGPEVPQLLQRLTTPSASGAGRVVLALRRAGRSEPLRVTLSPMQFIPDSVFGVARRPDNSWNFLLDHKRGVGYIRVGFIESTTPGEMRAALNELLSAGVRGLILDLRGCPGGWVPPTVEFTNLFLKSKVVATVRAANVPEQRHTSGDQPLITGIPIMLLVNEETRGGGEMIAAAFQDHQIALVSGQRTFGKGSVQTTDSQNPLGWEIKLTTGLFTRPSGKNLHRFPDSQPTDAWGVRPNPGLDLPISPDLSKQLKEWQRQQALRPGASREILPLDDPENDPQRQFALRELVKRLK